MMTTVRVFLSTIPGNRRDVVSMCPNEQANAATQGVLILITSLFGGLTAGYAIWRACYGTGFGLIMAGILAPIWAGFVYCVDRLLIAWFDKSAGPRRQALQTLVRLPQAVLLAILLAVPLMLGLSQRTLELSLLEQRDATLSTVIAGNVSRSGLPGAETEARESFDQVRANEEALKGDPDTNRYRVAAQNAESLQDRHARLVTDYTPRIDRAQQERARLRGLNESIGLTQDEADQDLVLKNRISTMQREISRAEAAARTAAREVAEARAEWLSALTARLDEARAASKVATKRLLDLRADVGTRNAADEATVVHGLQPDLVNLFRTFRRIVNDPAHPDRAALLWWEIGLHLFGLMLELTPIALKVMARTTPLDKALKLVEAADEKRIEALVKLVEETDAAATEALRVALAERAGGIKTTTELLALRQEFKSILAR
jgi:hypothetical protein